MSLHTLRGAENPADPKRPATRRTFLKTIASVSASVFVLLGYNACTSRKKEKAASALRELSEARPLRMEELAGQEMTNHLAGTDIIIGKHLFALVEEPESDPVLQLRINGKRYVPQGSDWNDVNAAWKHLRNHSNSNAVLRLYAIRFETVSDARRGPSYALTISGPGLRIRLHEKELADTIESMEQGAQNPLIGIETNGTLQYRTFQWKVISNGTASAKENE